RNKQVPEGLSQIIEKMMAKKPNDRYENYSSLIEDLEAFQAGKKRFVGKAGGSNKALNRKTAVSSEREGRSSFIVLDREILESSEEIELRRCGMLRRFLALGTDIVILCLLFTLYFKGYNSSDVPQSTAAISLWCALFLVITFLYFYLGDARGGMTLGKILFRCRVGFKDGENIGFKTSFLRTLLFFPILFAPGAITERSDLVDFITTFFKAGAGIFGVNPMLHRIGELNPVAYLVAQICVLWLVISFGFFIVTPGRTLLHDLISRSFFFSFVRRKPGRAVDASVAVRRATATGNRSAATPMTPETRADRKRPPPLPKDAVATRVRMPGYTSIAQPPIPAKIKSPRLALLLSFFPGLGQLYNGDYFKGLIILLTFWLILPWMFGFIDAYFRARSINRMTSLTPFPH
ncbi:MAG: RDD family protein, partial [Planctomycetota bacterium]